MRKFALLFAMSFVVASCSTISKWTSDTMDWADRTFPTYDDWFGGESAQPQQIQQQYGYQQQQGYPPEPVYSQPMSQNQEIYYDNTQRGYSFER